MAGPEPLDVWLYGTRVARVEEARIGKFRLSYTDEAFDRFQVGRPLLSVSLPLEPGTTHPPGRTGPFLEGLLPEGEARSTLEERFGLRRGDTYGLLSEIGRDCAGAVVIVPAGHPHPEVHSGDPEPIDGDELAREIRALPERPLGADDRVRVSLAGQQGKLLLVGLGDGGWARPLHGYPSTHILKPEDPRFPGMAANEALCMRIAKHVGLTSADVEVLDVDGTAVIAVERYDRRRAPDGTIERIHQEDVCQALAVDVGAGRRRKYEDDGGPSFADVAAILEVHAADGPDQAARLAQVAALTVAVGNADAHGKNLSLLQPPDTALRLAPLYDIASTVHCPRTPGGRDVSTSLAMSINDRTDVNDVTAADIVAEATRWTPDPNLTEDDLAEFFDEILDAVHAAAQQTPEADGGLAERMATRTADLRNGNSAGGDAGP